MESDINTEDDSPEPSKAGLARAKLKLVAHYAMLGFAPVVSVVALVIAVITSHNQSDQAQHSEYASRIDGLNSALSETQAEVESLKVALARERSIREEEHKKQDERDAKIVQNVTHLQTKSKVSPTLEEQLREARPVPAAVPPVALAASAPVAVSAPAASEKKSIVISPAPKSAGKHDAQVEALKKAIDQFNKK